MRAYILTILILLGLQVLGQSTKRKLSTSRELFSQGKYAEALVLVNEILANEASLKDALQLKTTILLVQEHTQEAQALFEENKSIFETSDNIDFLLFYLDKMGRFGEVKKLYSNNKPAKMKLEHFEFYLHALYELQEFDTALICANHCIENYSEQSVGYYYKGLCQETKSNYSQAYTNYQKAVYFLDKQAINQPTSIRVFKGMARITFLLSSYPAAVEWCEKVLVNAPNDFEMNRLKGQVLLKQTNYTEASLFLQKALESEPENLELIRELYELSILQKLPKETLRWTILLTSIDKENKDYRFLRAKAYLENLSSLQAYIDLKQLKNSGFVHSELDDLMDKSKVDRKKPNIIVITPLKDTIYSGSLLNNQSFSGRIEDDSPIHEVKINGQHINFSHDSINSFSVSIDISKADSFVVSVSDVYDNLSFKKITVNRDTIKPVVKINFPQVYNKSLVPDNSSDKELFIELTATDNFDIIGLQINGSSKAIKTSKQVKYFDRISIENMDSLIIDVTDKYLNTSHQTYFIDRKKADENNKNPMGRTFLLLISNSEYKNIPALTGPQSDAAFIKAAMSKYAIDSIIHLENLTLPEFKRLFEKDINKLANEYNVKSLVIWYSGHGKYSEYHNTGYWLPVESTIEDFDSFFSLREMKISLSGMKRLKHLLVISDACETGKSFYTQKISRSIENSCDDWTQTKMSSVECFTSSDGELSADNSLFAKTFTSVLNNNPNSCISIGTVAEKVKEIVETHQAQKPIFGHITGMEDENGSFVFIKR